MSLNTFFYSIYLRMGGALILSAITAYLTVHSPLIFVLQTPALMYGLMGIQLILVLGMQFLINRLSPALTNLLFIIYAALNGVTMSGFLLYFLTNAFNLTVIIFFVAASLFAFLAFIGFTTKKDLSGWGGFLYAAVWGILISSLVNIFLQSSLFDTVLSAIALVIFAALTVYDNQYFKQLHAHSNDDGGTQKIITIGALHMYINFIMIFQNLLSLSSWLDD